MNRQNMIEPIIEYQR